MDHTKALETHQLSVNYGSIPVLWDISMKIPSGIIAGVIGPNGAGKTTLIKTVMGLVPPISGKVEFFGLPLDKARQRVAYVPQKESVDWDFPITVRELVVMGRYGHLGILRWPRQADYAAADHYIEMVGMTAYRNRQIGQLSGGQQQRVFLARAMVQEADLYLMDEPFTGIDLATCNVLMAQLHHLREKGKTVLVVHHDLKNVKSYFDWVVMLNMRLVAVGPRQEAFNPETLKKTYGTSFALLDEALKVSEKKEVGLPEDSP